MKHIKTTVDMLAIFHWIMLNVSSWEIFLTSLLCLISFFQSVNLPTFIKRIHQDYKMSATGDNT